MSLNLSVRKTGSSFRNLVLIVLQGLMLFLTGCNSQPAKPNPGATADKPFTGQTVRFSVPSGLGLAEEWRSPLDEWAAETGANYSIREASGWERAESPATLAERTGGTLVLFPLTKLGETVAAGTWQSIPESVRRETGLDWLEIFAGLRENVCSPGRDPQFIPLNVPVLVCCYREDLLKKAGLSPPQTWNEYHDLLQRLPEWAPGLSAVEPWCPEFRSTLFLARAAAHAKHAGHFSFLFDIGNGDPLIDTPGFVRSLEQARADLPLLAKNVLTLSPRDCRRELLEGRAAMALTYETGPGSPPALLGPACAGDISDGAVAKSKTTGLGGRKDGMQFAFIPLPGVVEVYNLSVRAWETRSDRAINRASLVGFAGLMAAVAAPATAAERDAAWNAIAKFTRAEGAPHFPDGILSATRQSHFDSPRLFVGKSLTENEARQYLNVVSKCLQDSQLVLDLPIPNREAYRTALSNGVTDALQGKSTPQKALQQVADAWKALNQATGVEMVRDQYCRGIGQRPPLQIDAKASKP